MRDPPATTVFFKEPGHSPPCRATTFARPAICNSYNTRTFYRFNSWFSARVSARRSSCQAKTKELQTWRVACLRVKHNTKVLYHLWGARWRLGGNLGLNHGEFLDSAQSQAIVTRRRSDTKGPDFFGS